ncbi:MAG: thioredoxin-dependent thiol peroxidase [Thermoplasmata archaeon]
MTGSQPKEGQPAPEFRLPSTEGKEISLKDLQGRNVVLYFYPRDDTPGCTKEACSFRDTLSAFEETDSVILGVSLDDLKSHEKFRSKHGLPFPLLSDTNGEVSKAYGVYKKKKLYGREFWGIERTTFIIGKDGVIRRVFPRVKVDGHTEEVLDFVRENL